MTALIEQVLKKGVIDESYSTVNNGYVFKYKGEALVEDESQILYAAFGYLPTGTPEFVNKQGGISFIRLGLKEALKDLENEINYYEEEIFIASKEYHQIMSRVPGPDSVHWQRVVQGLADRQEYDRSCVLGERIAKYTGKKRDALLHASVGKECINV